MLGFSPCGMLFGIFTPIRPFSATCLAAEGRFSWDFDFHHRLLTHHRRNQKGLGYDSWADIELLTERYAAQIAALLSCWDRVLVFGTLLWGRLAYRIGIAGEFQQP
jgi:hypothetical protein